MAKTKPSGDDLAEAIATIKSQSVVKLSNKELMGNLQVQNPSWKLTERRVSKYDKKLTKYQKQRSKVSVAESDNGDEESVGSTASNASAVARRLMLFGSSVRKSLSLRGDNFQTGAPTVLSHTIDFVHEVDRITPKKETNLLPQLEDDSKSFSEDDGCFKVQVNHASSATEETLSPKSGDSFDDYRETNSVENGFIPEEAHAIDNIEAITSSKVAGDRRNISAHESSEAIRTINQRDLETTFGKDNDILSGGNDAKKEGLVCEGCIVL
jgi:hypothetical protein